MIDEAGRAPAATGSSDAPDGGLTVAVIGSAGAVAAAVLERLDADRAVARILAVDCDEPQMPVAKLVARTADVRDVLLPLALDGADVVVHLGTTPGPQHDEDTMFAVNVNGTRNALAAAAQVGARRFVHVSTGAVYGAHPGNTVPLTEDAPLRANPDFSWAYQHRLAEEHVQAWADAHPDVAVTILRPATTLGPGVDGFAARHLEQPRLPVVRGHAPPLQLLHVDDLATAVQRAVTGDLPGVYNVAAEGWLPATDLARLLGKHTVEVPETVAFSAARRLWARGVVPAPAGALHYLMHPWVLSTERLRATGWAPTRSHREIVREFVAEHAAYVSLGRARARRRDVYVAVFAALGAVTGLLLAGRGSRRR